MIRSFLILLAATVANISYAKEGEPIAVRIWPDDVVSIENQWNLKLAIHRGDDASIPSIAECDKSVGLAETLRHALSRAPNQPKPSWMPADQCKDDANRIAVNSDHSGSVRVICDGVHVVVMDDSAEAITAGDQPQADVVVPLDWKSADARQRL